MIDPGARARAVAENGLWLVTTKDLGTGCGGDGAIGSRMRECVFGGNGALRWRSDGVGRGMRRGRFPERVSVGQNSRLGYNMGDERITNCIVCMYRLDMLWGWSSRLVNLIDHR